MASTPDYSWPPMETRKVMGQGLKRVDGPQKASAAREVRFGHQPARRSVRHVPHQPARAMPG